MLFHPPRMVSSAPWRLVGFISNGSVVGVIGRSYCSQSFARLPAVMEMVTEGLRVRV